MLLEKIQLEEDEKVLRIVRRHWFIALSELFGLVFMALLPLFLLFLVTAFPNAIQLLTITTEHTLAYVTIGMSVWFLFLIMTGFMIWTHFYLDIWLLTTKRLVIIDQVHFFHRTVSVLRLENIQDIEYNINGLLATFLNFGTVKVQSASSFEQNFKSNGLPDPKTLQSIIQKAADERISARNQR